MKFATCHPSRTSYAKGLCSACYQRQFRKSWTPKKPATCHPDKAAKCGGLCNACYQKKRASPEWVAVGRATAANTCGHPDKPHVGHGMCGGCLTAARRRKNREQDKVSRKDYQLRAKYGITLDDFNRIFAAQDSRCALCRREIATPRDRHVDHCHDTGRVRGIICFSCNKALGLLGDSPAAIKRALDYVSYAQAGVFIPMERAA